MIKSLILSLSIWLIALSMAAQTKSESSNDKLIAADPEQWNSREKLIPSALVIVNGEKISDGIIFVDPGSVKSVSILKGQEAFNIYGDDGKNGVIIVTTEQQNSICKLRSVSKLPEILLVIDGEKCTNKLNWIDPNNIKSITVLKGEEAIKIYGASGDKGVILITTI